jgi:spore germination protein YaaH
MNKLLGVLLLCAFGASFATVFGIGKQPVAETPLGLFEISGWVAWWEEQKAYDLIQNNHGKIREVSPVWFMVGDNFSLAQVGTLDKKKITADLKSQGLKVLPTLGSELSSGDINSFIEDKVKTKDLVAELVSCLLVLDADGVDIDLESIRETNRDNFNLFLGELAGKLRENNLAISVTVPAQTRNEAFGYDLKRIGEIADEVRIMAYDKHSASTVHGAIAPIYWINAIAKYNLTMMDKSKIVMGIPSYGYIWSARGGAKGLQFYEFNEYIKDFKYQEERDTESGELIVSASDFVGRLSDSYAISRKIESLRSIGINRFIIWHLGGMDERFFQ